VLPNDQCAEGGLQSRLSLRGSFDSSPRATTRLGQAARRRGWGQPDRVIL